MTKLDILELNNAESDELDAFCDAQNATFETFIIA